MIGRWGRANAKLSRGLDERQEGVRSIAVAAQSHVHAVVKTVPKPLKPGKAPGKPWIRVRNAAGGKASSFEVID